MPYEFITGATATAAFFGLASWLGKVWAARILEADRTRYQTQMEMVLQDLRTRSSKELFVHQLQFEKEFQIYLDLWKESLILGRAASEYRSLKFDSGKTREQERDEFAEAYSRFSSRVFDHRPFYTPEVYDMARAMLKNAGKVHRLQGKADPTDVAWSKTEELLDEINAAIDPLCDAIRRRIWTRSEPSTVENVARPLMTGAREAVPQETAREH